MTKQGIDVSHWQGDIDWEAVKADGVEFAIIKAGGSDAGFYEDSKFRENYEAAKAAGVCVGAYYFVGALCKSAEDGAADAERFIDILQGKQFEYPVYIDFEGPDSSDIEGNTDAVIAFCEVMENAGYFVGVYASEFSGFRERLDDSRLQHISHWVARYGDRPSTIPEDIFHIWQYASDGSVAGIDGNVDMDVSYVDLETVIKNNYLNGFTACQPEPEPEPEPESEPEPEPEPEATEAPVELTLEERVSALEEKINIILDSIVDK